MKNLVQDLLRKFGYSILRSKTAEALLADVSRLSGHVSILEERLAKKETHNEEPRVLNSQGIWVYVRDDDERGKQLVAAGGFLNPTSMKVWKLLLAENRWTHVIDVGANYGEMLCSTPMPVGAEVYAFEPSPVILPCLRKTVRESGLEISVIGAAVSDRIGVETLFIDSAWSGTTRFSREGDSSLSSGGVPVNTTTLETVLMSLKSPLEQISLLLKIDVEGHEISVLEGLRPVLSSLSGFECLIEVLHLPDDALEYLIAHFDMRYFHVERNELIDFSATSPEDFRSIINSAGAYFQDVVIRRKPAACITRA